ncbi:hypothetical protein RPC_0759 [Rhodopseudomonas palustris BisB18]|uniref:Transmembrane protein n=2 Tax=Rhodopseudomonas palustris TaxID=1076 RepID=Q21BA6_RHOPB
MAPTLSRRWVTRCALTHPTASPRHSGPQRDAHLSTSWPGLSRPSTATSAALPVGVGGRDKPGHDLCRAENPSSTPCPTAPLPSPPYQPMRAGVVCRIKFGRERAMTDPDQAPADGLTATAVLDRIRAELNEPAADDMQLLLKIAKDLATLDGQRWSPADAAAWTARPESYRELRLAALARQRGFKLGLLSGFLAGFVLTALFAALLAMHWLVVVE